MDYGKGMKKLVHTCNSEFLSMIDSLHFRQTINLTFPTNFVVDVIDNDLPSDPQKD